MKLSPSMPEGTGHEARRVLAGTCECTFSSWDVITKEGRDENTLGGSRVSD